ncbi:MFS transporter [Myxococcota bacterium]|nr:MFS transporter [Myxococcota bacterium]
MNPLSRNAWRVCVFHGLQMSLFPMAIITVFWKREIGMSMTEIMVSQACFGLAMAAFEFPSGYLADRIGYRRTLILASLLMAGGWAVYCLTNSFALVIGAEVVLGVAMSFVSGCDTALLYESVKQSGQEKRFSIWMGRYHILGQTAEGTAALAAGLLFAWWIRLPFLLEVGIWILAAVIAATMVEPARDRPPLRDNWSQVRMMMRHVLFENRSLRAVMGLAIVLGMSSFVPVWIIQIYATDSGVPEAWLGPIWAAANYTVAAGSFCSSRISAWMGSYGTLSFGLLMMLVGYLGLGFSHALFGFAFYFLITFFRGLWYPIMHHAEQRQIPSTDRAGFVSLRSMTFRILFMVVGPCVGLAIDGWGQHPVLIALGIAFAALCLNGLLVVRRSGAGATE